MNRKIFNIYLIIMIIGIFVLTGCTNKEKIGKDNGDKKSDSYIEAYIYDQISEESIQDIKKKVESIDKVISVKYISKEDAYDIALEQLGGDVSLMEGYTRDVHPFPASFIIKIKDSANTDSIVEEVKKYDIFRDVQLKINSEIAEYIYDSVF